MSGGRRAFKARITPLAALLAAFGALAACGQRGPLTLPGVEPEEPSDSAAAPSGAVPDVTEAAPAATESASEGEEEPAENER